MTRNWAEILAKPMPESPTAAQMLSYVKGYIMALEDILKDINEYEGVYANSGVEVISEALHGRIIGSLYEARQTLEHLQ